MINLAILGSTGSIGTQTLDIVRLLPEQFKVVGLAAGRNTGLLLKQIKEFQPKYVFSLDRHGLISAPEIKFLPMEELASLPEADIIVAATSGISGIKPVLEAIKTGKTVALANKESIVAAGSIIDKLISQNNARILPIDSEPSAVWQCLKGDNQGVAKLILTASGGPFRDYTPENMAKITPAQALKHPSWRMGPKITIDSATLMNKGMEIIEAHWLFKMPVVAIEIVIHPQSIIHSMVEYIDGSIKAQLSCPDMRLPILHALGYPNRLENPGFPVINWQEVHKLEFAQPDFNKFPCLNLAVEACNKGGTYPAVLCAADEAAVGLFLQNRIGFTEIAELVARALDNHQGMVEPGIEDIMSAATWAEANVLQAVNN